MKTRRVPTKRERHGICPAVCLACLILMGISGRVKVEGQSGMTSRNKDDGTGSGTDVANLYKQTGTDPSFESLLDEGEIPVGKSSSEGVEGSTIHVNKAIVEQGANGKNRIPNDINIHTLLN